ncbi:hypothetical protein JCM19232_2897 [Vibrio ishigakensis]|uniref:Probable membrane transporter protein n=2 Tax=Vibrio ishigakensis TaxID=1481914 RepID=A0A0B8PFA1_9VIBR|nr:hypothetical protein JCM19231_2207 [Vibrio ishigakensis]GAM65650.1 hypothetical protein JCM19232_2897 [Vibrio ishigakensis]
MLELFLILLLVGSVVGVLAGLLGIGGGLIIVPSLLYLFPYFGIPQEFAMQMALATSLACVVFTSASSAFNHVRATNFDLTAVKSMLPGVIVGGFVGSFIAEWVPTEYLPRVFGTIVLGLSLQMFISVRGGKSKDMPPAFATFGAGGAIGAVSSLAGIGGGSLMVPFLNRHSVEMRKAIGSSSICGAVLAISGMLGFILHGTNVQGLPSYSMGFVYLPALLAISSCSVLTTRVGVKLASSLPTPVLKRFFAFLLLFIAIRMLFS